jgi:hypothetical protein
MAAFTARRTGAFVVLLALVAAFIVVTAPTARSAGEATVEIGPCLEGANLTDVIITVQDGYAVDVFDADNFVVAYIPAPGATIKLNTGSYGWIVFAANDPLKTPLDGGEFVLLDCDATTTTTIATTTTTVETTTTTVETTTTTGETTTTTGETTTTTSGETTTTTTGETTTTSTPGETTTTGPGPTTSVLGETTTTVAGETTTTTSDVSGGELTTTSTTIGSVSQTTLPFTGFEPAGFALAGLGVLVGGSMLVISARKRRLEDTDTLGDW